MFRFGPFPILAHRLCTSPPIFTCMTETLQKSFIEDLDAIALDLIVLFKLEFKKEVAQLSSPLMRWLEFRMRYIDSRPRQLVLSDAFPVMLPATVKTGLLGLQNLMVEGGNLNPYQSKSMVQFHDASGKRRANRTDLLWADWGIHHLHITDVPLQGNRFSSRRCSDNEAWLLFCIVQPDAIGLIDVRKHDDQGLFADSSLIRLVQRSWPEYMNQFLLKGITPARENITAAELSRLRANGINAPLILDGQAYLNPGQGITSASTSSRVSNMARELRHWVAQLADFAANPNGQVQRDAAAHAVSSPQLHLCCSPQGLAIYEAVRNVGYALPVNQGVNSHSERMHDLLMPHWVIEKLVSAAAARG